MQEVLDIDAIALSVREKKFMKRVCLVISRDGDLQFSLLTDGWYLAN